VFFLWWVVQARDHLLKIVFLAANRCVVDAPDALSSQVPQDHQHNKLKLSIT